MAKSKVVTVIFLVALVVLAGLVTIRSAIIYQSATGYANQTTIPLVSCAGYVYSVSEADYTDGQLSFLLRNKAYSDDDIFSFMVSDGVEAREVAANVLTGTAKTITVEGLNINNSFFTSVKGCETYAKEHLI